MNERKRASSLRQLSGLDRILTEINAGLSSVFSSGPSAATRPNPAHAVSADSPLSPQEQRHSAGLMRVDHTGEICAQALYRGQALLAKKPETRDAFLTAAKEEEDHLVWCRERLQSLNAHPSYGNSFWYVASFLIGATASAWGDEWSNGFVVETEEQVERHLDQHLSELPANDVESRAILKQMKADEIAHAQAAKDRGARDLPMAVKALMRLQSRAMTTTAYWV